MQRYALDKTRQTCCRRHAREVIIAERGMARVTRDQYLVIGGALDPIFAVRQVSWLEGRVDADLGVPFLHAFQLPVAQAKSPGFTIVGGTVRNPVRRFRQREEVWLEFRERHGLVHRYAVVEHVEVAPSEVDES